MSRKSQIKMTETIGILVVFFILVLFGVIFYAQYQKSAIREQQEAAAAKRAISTSLKAFYLPEIRCTKAFDVAFAACVDAHKADIFRENINDNYNYYATVFGKSHIYLYDVIKNETMEIYEGIPAEWSRKIPIKFPVSIYNVTTPGTCGDIAGACSLGVLNVDVYE